MGAEEHFASEWMDGDDRALYTDLCFVPFSMLDYADDYQERIGQLAVDGDRRGPANRIGIDDLLFDLVCHKLTDKIK